MAKGLSQVFESLVIVAICGIDSSGENKLQVV
jgi:hypothetical protein